MGTRGEIFTQSVKAKNRSYFFNVKENTRGDVFLQIVESKETDGVGFERRSVVVFQDELQNFLTALDESLQFMEKNQKQKSKARFEKIQEERQRSENKTIKYENSDRASTANRASLFKKKKPRKTVRSNPHE